MDEKLLFLVLCERDMTFKQIQVEYFLDSTKKLHTALRRLAEYGLIYTHPLLLKRKPSYSLYKQLKALNIEILDKSPPAVLWAVSEDKKVIRGKDASYYQERLQELAVEAKPDMDRIDGILDLLE